jgi:hypothetical protein
VHSPCTQEASRIYDYSLLTPQLVLTVSPWVDLTVSPWMDNTGAILSIFSPGSQRACRLYLPQLVGGSYCEIHSVHDTRAAGSYDSTFIPRPARYSYSPNPDLIVFIVSIVLYGDDGDEDVEELFLVLHRASLVNLVSNRPNATIRDCIWEDWSPGIARWLPSLYADWGCSLFGWRIVLLESPGHYIHQLDLWGFGIMNTEWPHHDREERLFVIDFNPYQFRNATGEGDGPLSTYYDPEKTVQFAPSGSVGHPCFKESFRRQMPCQIWMAKEPIGVTGVGIAEDTIIGFQVCTASFPIDSPQLNFPRPRRSMV